ITREDFSKPNQSIFDGLLELRKMNFKNANTESLALVNCEFEVIKWEEKEAQIILKNEITKFEQERADEEVSKTKTKIEQILKEIATTTDVLKKEKLIKQITLLTREHKTMANRNAARTSKEITNSIQFDPSKSSIPTFIPEIDREINGGFERHNINVISATPHNGKTTLGVEAAANQAMNDFRVLYLSLEQIAENINQSVLGFVSE